MEVACERLKTKQSARLKSKDAAAELELYVPPLCSPSKDTPDGDDSIKDLNDAVMSWLESDSLQVLLLHGQSGSGKSLYVTVIGDGDGNGGGGVLDAEISKTELGQQLQTKTSVQLCRHTQIRHRTNDVR